MFKFKDELVDAKDSQFFLEKNLDSPSKRKKKTFKNLFDSGL